MNYKIKKIYQKLRSLSSSFDFSRNIFLLPKAIKYIYRTLLVSFAFLTAYKQFFWEKIYDIFQIKILEYHIVLRVWQVITLLFVLSSLTIISIYIYRKLKKYKKQDEPTFEIYENFKWRIAKDSFDKIIIEAMPYCITHDKNLSRGDNRNYLHCFDCEKTYRFDEINELCIRVRKFIKNKYNLNYLPKLIQ